MPNKLYVLMTVALAAMGVIAQGDATCRGKAVCGYCVVRQEPVTGRNIGGWCHHKEGDNSGALFCLDNKGCPLDF
ncbi:unnamed protein product [Cercospora beticola]|nr:unnamed protein product [Cercospora beticola]